MDDTALAIIGLGSNLPWRERSSVEIIASVMRQLRTLSAGRYLASSLWRTSPVDCPPGSGDFINAVVALAPAPAMTPEGLLACLKQFEAAHERPEPARRNAPRPLDLDLLAFGQQRRHSATLQLPHPRAMQRRFVLAPLAEILPTLCWPGTARTVAEWLATLDESESVARLAGV
ncbi:MAG: 2-amino-4-hydroxy-6-hydroxymethyldihydropteridine diphosphokinase [Pseudomonadales bacterium]|nr:2-amino-4-hydroxy-6-hydroxymethyldihydropteridine diphosphokinase [Pseudomonadales bacterium]MCP5182894.1 2-amino-4-hydroxy-6-hydroxymethyldihydropteridine diphosphokinase [Pseudomonadales bacterium]